MEKIFKDNENPLKDFLEQTLELDNNDIHISSGIALNPGLPYKQKMISIPRNLVHGTEYCLGGYKVTQTSISNNVITTLQTLNTIQEELSFLILRQLPILCRKQTQNLEENKQIKIELENHLGKLIKQLEINRQNIKTDILETDLLNKKEYETLHKHQEKILNIVTEKSEKQKEILEIKNYIQELKDSIEKNNQYIQKTFEQIETQIKDLNTKI